MPIALLPDPVVAKIAAGEVIERPSSIVKELLENSLDAGATRIEVRVTDGGRHSISVTDDGCGISAHEVPLALLRHATSKITSMDDLLAVKSFGFRGEALASIAAVSTLDLLTRTVGSVSGTHVKVVGGEIKLIEPEGTPAGTTVAMSNLFFNVPVRQKFLRSKATELSHIDTVIRKAALAQISREFLLEHEEELLFHFPQAASLLERLMQLYGGDVTQNLIAFAGDQGDVAVHGYVSNSQLSFKKAEEIWIFVNGRPIRDRMLQASVMEGYRTATMEHRYPLAAIYLDVPNRHVDVNVHPSKAEVRFSEPQMIFRLLADSIAKTLRTRPALGSTVEASSALPFQESGEVHPSRLGYEELATFSQPSVARSAPLPYLQESGTSYFSTLEVFSSLDHTYLLCKNRDSLLVIDQHAAHERVKFEILRKNFTSAHSVEQQRLLLPITLDISEKHQTAMTEITPLLSKLGFDLEPFGPRTIVIKGVPAVLGQNDPRPLLLDLLTEEEESGTAFEERVDDIFSRIACHSAVRAHDRLETAEIRSLLAQMDQTDLSTNCPHGRPTFLRFGLGDFERLFGRK